MSEKKYLPFQDDKILVTQLLENDTQSFDAIYFRYYEAVFANISRLINRKEDAEEILQDVFVSLWEKRNTLNPSLSIGGWLIVVSRHKSINFLEKKIREKLDLMGEVIEDRQQQQPVFPVADEIDSQILFLHKAISRLPPKQRRAFILCKLQFKTYAQASVLLEISPHTVREYVAKAMDKIKGELLQVSPDMITPVLLLLSFNIT